MDMEMENLEREMLEAESAEEEIQERLDRNRELQVGIENELVRQRGIQVGIENELVRQHGQSEFEIAEDFERRIMIRAYHASFDGPNHELWQNLIRREGASFFTSSEYFIPEELERDIRNQRWNEEQSEIADRRWQAELDRELEDMDAIESHFVRFVRPRFTEPRVEPRRPQVVESEFEGLAEEVIMQFLQSEPPMPRGFGDRIPPVAWFQEEPRRIRR